MSADPTAPLPRRLGWMADAMVHAKLGPRQRFFSRECVDEIVLLLREAEKALLDAEAERRAAKLLSKFGEATGASTVDVEIEDDD